MPLTTLDDFAAHAATFTPGGRAKFDPITLAVILAILSATLSELVTRCFDWLWPRKAANAGRFARWQLRRGPVWRACQRVAAERGLDALTLYREHADDVCGALVSAGATMTEDDFARLRALKGSLPC